MAASSNGDRTDGRDLVVVESPAKASTLEKYLGGDYRVEASVGHVRDLPESGLGVDTEHGFEPEYVTIEGKGKVLKKLRDLARSSEHVYLATDPDREGEAIAFHVARELGYPRDDGDRFRRVVFHEITKDAVVDAFRQPGDINMDLVEAQQARRILDRLVGYKLSPLLWKKISRGLSAGRVQSVAVRVLVERERARRAFRRARYWDLQAQLAKSGQGFEADLIRLNGDRLAQGRDFDDDTGELIEGRDVIVLDEEEAGDLREELAEKPFTVASVDERTSTRSPYAPFTTSSLQQEANRKLNMTASQTMSVAQRLYEAGHITYMRTDSVNLSEQAIRGVRSRVDERYGDDYLRSKPRRYRTDSDTAQEAHEAIRPAGAEMKTAKELGLRGRQKALYDLIWKRTMATQMTDARQRHLTVLLEADGAEFRATGKILDFPGFFRAYVEGSDDPEEALEDREILLPELEEGETVECRELEAVSHETRPPSRFTEASLVKELESAGVGRPSTYAAIISTIQERGYVEKNGKQLVPTWTAFAVTKLLEDHFPDLVDTGFTARMENTLDRIASGEENWREYLEVFYLGGEGEEGFESRLADREEAIDPREASTIHLQDLEPSVRIGRYGPYLEMGEDDDRVTASVPEGVAPADLENEEAVELLKRKAEGPVDLGEHPDAGKPVYLKTGPYGPYVQLGDEGEDGGKPRRASLPDEVDFEEVTLEMAVKLLAMPYPLGEHPDDGKPVKVGIGRYGPYVVHEGDFRSLKSDDSVLDMTLDRALELLAEPKKGRRSSRKSRELGEHPDDGKPVKALEGRYGPYVKHGDTNASLPDGTGVDEVSLEEAVELIEEKRAKATS
ncbi:MAG: type I DNA topoisomerase [Candidatus Palauibacterales bacterium]|nr:type I DNA topoisomerase [Candidatus Palauibacterales bacterium]